MERGEEGRWRHYQGEERGEEGAIREREREKVKTQLRHFDLFSLVSAGLTPLFFCSSCLH